MSNPFPIENRAGLAEERFAPWRTLLRTQSSVKQILDWMFEHNPPLAPADLLAQDEFSHDLIVPVREGYWLVYDCT
ncbi:hypothetical protein KIH39_07570 [Telmatocola sphagniphila]|uniref:Uncharacterized protein n=1 Tax=Telmatocola sphagniphila TaxID=1123043 RepID=A0A8E6B9S0_9BACT|nr:hypothetical protein [Telmatocola sphagniphila]QVL33756.1 hypothetical protein KIH39_07570 [Telmatocola sphagniphila]